MKKLSTIALIASIVLMSACGPKDPGLKDAYKNYFLMGVAVTPRNVTDSLQSSIILKEFNSITAENCMKPGELHPAPGVWNLEQADIIANFCREHGIKMRGHCLVWHSQFANWMFNKYDENGNQVVERDEKGDTIWVEQQVRGGFGGFGGQRPQGQQAQRPQGQQAQQGQRPQGQPGQAPQGFQGFGGQRPQGQQAQAQAPQTVKVPKYVRATKEEFYDSLRAHINFVVNRYKDVIYCWDVVNEAMSDANNPDAPYEQTFRQTQAYQLCGDEFIKNAFIWAHEADPEAGLFYNDYSAWTPAKRTYIYNMVKKLQAEGAPITGIGMQGHYNIFDNPTIEDFEKAIQMYLELVDDVQITEFDVRINHEAGGGLSFSRGEDQVLSDTIAKMQQDKYDQLFQVMRKYKKNISCVTFWNLSDRDSWLGANNFPLLFDRDYQRKPVYYTVRDFKKKK
ncbi:MAG: endo-1,4-beta-xylanase [Bacteroidaceae bacterium]|jgi:GH35 family endo-1,4-beta-xylanase|nr:MAG: Endo-1,4-beta-xylanase/feruloyl esterase precursor [Bacteroidetes bacterium ADurb.BinA104]